MRIRDWSSDVCSSDLEVGRHSVLPAAGRSSAPDFARVVDEVAAHDLLDPAFGIAALSQQTGKLLELGRPVKVEDEGHGVRVLAGRADAGGAPVGDLLGDAAAIGGHVVDAGRAAVGADADMVLG